MSWPGHHVSILPVRGPLSFPSHQVMFFNLRPDVLLITRTPALFHTKARCVREKPGEYPVAVNEIEIGEHSFDDSEKSLAS